MTQNHLTYEDWENLPPHQEKRSQQTNLEITQMFKRAYKDFEVAVVIILLYYNSTQALSKNRREGNTSQLIP